jgi:C1A family cysteine protease
MSADTLAKSAYKQGFEDGVKSVAKERDAANAQWEKWAGKCHEAEDALQEAKRMIPSDIDVSEERSTLDTMLTLLSNHIDRALEKVVGLPHASASSALPQPTSFCLFNLGPKT